MNLLSNKHHEFEALIMSDKNCGLFWYYRVGG